MGAIFFYIFIYFIAYYSTNVVNLLSVRPLIRNRYIAALVPVFLVAMSHGYMIANSPPPPDTDMTVESALGSFVIMPVVIVVIGALYFMWKKKDDDANLRNEKASDAGNDALSRSKVADDDSGSDEVSAEKASADNKNLSENQTAEAKHTSDKKEPREP